MKPITYTILFASAIICFIACKKSSTPPVPGFNATINGNKWVATTYEAALQTDTNTGLTAISITGFSIVSGLGKSINLHINNYKSGTFTISKGGSSTASYGYGPQVDNANSGSVTLSYITDSTVSGTFSFVADSIKVTAGSFTSVRIH